MDSTSYEIKLISKSPIVQAITLSAIKTILQHKLSYTEKQVIDSELVPNVSKRVALASLKEEVIPPRKVLMQYQRIRPPTNFNSEFMKTQVMGSVSGDYGKITPLLRDPSVSTIECSGADKPLMIFRSGQKQITKILLNEIEIKQILEEIANKAKVPLMDGVFKALVENFSINAVVSEIVGSKFVIKKQTPYAILER